MELERIVANLVQKVERRFYGKYRGFVKDNADSEQLGRLKVTVPSVLGKDIAVWAFPCVPYGGGANHGFLFIPEKDSGVWVEFEEGDPEFPIWTGTFWSKPGGESELPKPNGADGSEEGAVQDPPTRKIIKTKSGHTLQFEDTEGEGMITIEEAEHNHVITLDGDGIKITDGQNSGNTVTMDSGGVIVEDKNGNQVILESGGIKLGSSSAVEPLVLGTMLNTILSQFLIALNTHQHTGNMGAPTPILVPLQLDISSALSQKHKTE